MTTYKLRDYNKTYCDITKNKIYCDTAKIIKKLLYFYTVKTIKHTAELRHCESSKYKMVNRGRG